MPRAGLAQKKEFVAKALCPRILVVNSADLDDTWQVNSADSFAELLAPFGQDVSAQITIQDGQGAPYFLDKINVKFTTDFVIDKQRQLSGAEVDELVTKCIGGSSASEHVDPAFMGGAAGVNREAVALEEISAWSPWYTLFRQQWVNQMQASEHESFMHPVACMLAVSSSDADPVGSLRSLLSHPAVRRTQTQSFTGSNLVLYYVVVHDERRTADVQNIDHRFDLVRKVFGQNCSLLRINSNTDLLDADSSDRAKISGIWSSSLATAQPLAAPSEKVYGSMLTMRDVAALRDAVKQMMVRSVVPHMQYVVRILSDQTAGQRRGITGRLFSAGRRYFGASAKTSSTLTGVDGDMYFRYDSPEAMMRQLADYSFMLKDFRFAQSVYQVARRDFLAEKAWKCYAGAQEMVGLSKLMWEVQATKAEFDSNFDDAITTYLHKTQVPRTFLAVRSVIMYYELLKHHKMHSFAPVALLRIPRGFISLGALMNEQAAYAYLKLTPRSEVRKFSFYAMIASQMYQKSGMSELSHRCLRMVKLALATPIERRQRHAGDSENENESEKGVESKTEAKAEKSITEDSNSSNVGSTVARSSWGAIDSFINHELGRQYSAVQSYDEALQYFMALVGDDKIPPKLQSKYLQELLQLFLESDDRAAKGSAKGGACRSNIQLSIPVIDPHMARIIMSPSLEGEDGLLEWRLDGSAPKPATAPALALGSAPASNPGRGSCCAVGEAVAVLLVVTNPLTIGVTLNNFTLDCEFTASDDVEEEVASAFEVTTVSSVILEGGQTTMVTVEVVAKRPGELSITGAKYLLCDILPTFKPLRLPGRRLNNTKEQQAREVYSPDTTLKFRVSPDMPHLDISIEGFPDTLMSGSMHQSSVIIVNKGTLPCHNIVLWLSHPSFFDVKSPRTRAEGSERADTHEVYTALDKVNPAEVMRVPNTLQDCSRFVLVGEGKQQCPEWSRLVPVECLNPGETLVMPVWTRGDRVGAHSLSLCVGASSNVTLQSSESQVMRSRTFDIDLIVTPSLRVNAFVRPSARCPRERLLGIEIENMQTDLNVQLVQTTFSSGHYELMPILAQKQQAEGVSRRVVVGPRQTVSMMYRARPRQVETGDARAVPEKFTINALRQFIYSNNKPTLLPEPIELVYSNMVLGDHSGVDCVHSSLQSYILRSQAFRRRNMLRANYPMIPENYHRVLFPLFETFGIDFVLFWNEVGGMQRSGHHSITGIDLGVPHDYINEALNPPTQGAARAWLADTVKEREALVQSIANRPNALTHRHERPLDVSMRVGAIRQGASSESALSAMYVADITVTVYNHSWRYAYDFALDLISPADLDQIMPDRVRLDYTGSRSAWSWYGKTNHELVVGPQASVELSARLVCLSPGMFDIGLWKLSAAALEPVASASGNTDPRDSPALRLPFSSKNLECVLHPLQSYFVDINAAKLESHS
ncbi:hypothetical protein GGF37_001222 [Kickxella alabastrina]|nr:hypothetical protein GGF37_001222 [Kickxella alabastrina]